MEKFEIKKFKECNIEDPFFDSLKDDYPNFTQWFYNHPERPVYINEGKQGINALLILKDEESDQIILKDTTLPIKPRIKICTLKLNESIRNKRLGEGTIGIALWHWQKRPEEEIYVTVFPKHNGLITLLSKFGFKDYGEFSNGEHLFVKSKKSMDFTDPYTLFPYINGNRSKFGILPIEDIYHDMLFPYSELKNEELFDSDLAVSNGISKIYIATPYTNVVYEENEPIFIYRKFNGENPGYKSVLTSFCTISKIHYIKKNNRYLMSKEEYLKIIKNKSVYSLNELENIYKSEKNNIIILELIYNGYFGKGNNINWSYLKQNNFIGDNHFYQTITNRSQFSELLKKGGKDEKNIIINKP